MGCSAFGTGASAKMLPHNSEMQISSEILISWLVQCAFHQNCYSTCWWSPRKHSLDFLRTACCSMNVSEVFFSHWQQIWEFSVRTPKHRLCVQPNQQNISFMTETLSSSSPPAQASFFRKRFWRGPLRAVVMEFQQYWGYLQATGKSLHDKCRTHVRKCPQIVQNVPESWEPVGHLQGLSGPPGPKPRKNLKKVSRGLRPRGPPESLEKVSKKSRESGKSLEKVSRVWKKSRKGPENTFSRLLPDSRGTPGPNSMTGSERPSLEPLLKKRGAPSHTGGDIILEMLSRLQKSFFYRAWAIPAALSTGIPGNALRAFPGSFRNSCGISSGKSQPYWGCGPKNAVWFSEGS